MFFYKKVSNDLSTETFLNVAKKTIEQKNPLSLREIPVLLSYKLLFYKKTRVVGKN